SSHLTCRLRLRGHYGRAAGHRLDERQPEALVRREVRDAAGPAVEPRELVVGDEAEPLHARTGDVYVAPAAHARDQQARSVQPGLLEPGHEALEVLARLERPHGQHVVALGRLAR